MIQPGESTHVSCYVLKWPSAIQQPFTFHIIHYKIYTLTLQSIWKIHLLLNEFCVCFCYEKDYIKSLNNKNVPRWRKGEIPRRLLIWCTCTLYSGVMTNDDRSLKILKEVQFKIQRKYLEKSYHADVYSIMKRQVIRYATDILNIYTCMDRHVFYIRDCFLLIYMSVSVW